MNIAIFLLKFLSLETLEADQFPPQVNHFIPASIILYMKGVSKESPSPFFEGWHMCS